MNSEKFIEYLEEIKKTDNNVFLQEKNKITDYLKNLETIKNLAEYKGEINNIMSEYIEYIKKKFKEYDIKNITESITDRINNINKIKFYDYDDEGGHERIYVVNICFANPDYENIKIEAGVPHRITQPFIKINGNTISNFYLHWHSRDSVTGGTLDELFEIETDIFDLILVTFLAEKAYSD